MDQKILESCLGGLPTAALRYFRSIDSTNEEAFRWLEEDAPNFSLVVADEQTAGRGRQWRKWYTPPASALAFSLILRPPFNKSSGDHFPAGITRLTALGALGVSSAMKDDFDLPAKIKWPNDLFVRGHKIAGVLVEASWSGELLSAAVIGIGINVSPPSIQNQVEFDTPATCIENEINRQVSRPELLRQVLSSIFMWNKQIQTDAFLEAWNERLLYRGEWVYLIQEAGDPPKLPLEVLILGLEQDGAIKIQLKDGSIQTVYSSEYRITGAL
jgi:BirA family biotin operon repressor/biotin-[acetyl-CoA-carboxylase] ligase